MALLNTRKKELQLKMVYYGPGRGGKTSTLEYIQTKLAEQASARMLQMKSREERTLFFDFYPLKVGRVNGFDIRVQLYSVPGQSRLQPLRKLVLRGVDSIVFVADAMALKKKSNLESFDNLLVNLKDYQIDFSRIPFLIQLNKADLGKESIPLLSGTEIKQEMISRVEPRMRQVIEGAPVFATSAVTGENVLRGLEAIIRLTVNRLDFETIARRR